MNVDDFDYLLPDERIAQRPVSPRHDSRLFDTRTGTDRRFLDLADLLEPGDLVVVNRTRVRSARLRGTKATTGGAVELLLLSRTRDGFWESMVRPARRLSAGTVVEIGSLTAELVTDPVDGVARVWLSTSRGGDEPTDIEAAIAAVGELPLPPYITEELGDPDLYQTMFADRVGSAAAPTAGLHFTPQVVAQLEGRGVEIAHVELDVGLATFRPIATKTIEDHRIHREACRIGDETAAAIDSCRRRGGRVVAVGTTVVRTLETFAQPDGSVSTGERETDLYLIPGSTFRVVDLLVTNFHLPRSSLLVLVEAFMGPRWREVYRTALERRYRFLSFGDAMLCERQT
jgi:S-adenosylmethionine:tRNA ribosyltransferase-isomerase